MTNPLLFDDQAAFSQRCKKYIKGGG